jgi:hypothetical protein
MYGTIWRFAGDPDDLLRGYEAMLADIPTQSMVAHLCLRVPDGIVVVDTCPSLEVHRSFAATAFPELRRRHGLPDPDPAFEGDVHAAFLDGRRAA